MRAGGWGGNVGKSDFGVAVQIREDPVFQEVCSTLLAAMPIVKMARQMSTSTTRPPAIRATSAKRSLVFCQGMSRPRAAKSASAAGRGGQLFDRLELDAGDRDDHGLGDAVARAHC